jgi:quercetin dioxygenase-like cupin family protein
MKRINRHLGTALLSLTIVTSCVDGPERPVAPRPDVSGSVASPTIAVGVTTSRWNGVIPAGHFKYHNTGNVENTPGLKLELKTNMATDFIISSVVVAPGGQVGWHTHNGPVFINIRRGTLTLLESRGGECERRDVGPGGLTILEQGTGVHNGYNLSTSENVEYATVGWAPRGVPQRVDISPAPACTP